LVVFLQCGLEHDLNTFLHTFHEALWAFLSLVLSIFFKIFYMSSSIFVKWNVFICTILMKN
jgi:hypothetical protein